MCRLASKILADRAVWEEALRQLYARDSLFEPSFEPLGSMDLVCLKKAALRFDRVHARLFNGPGRVGPTRGTLLDCPLQGADGRYITGVQMVPGGRYVIGAASDKYVCVWDLGPPGSAMKPPEELLVCTEEVPCEVIVSISCPLRASDSSFRFAIHASGRDPAGSADERSVRYPSKSYYDG